LLSKHKDNRKVRLTREQQDYIKSNLKFGDIQKIIDRSGFSRPTVNATLEGKHFNTDVIKVTMQIVEENKKADKEIQKLISDN